MNYSEDVGLCKSYFMLRVAVKFSETVLHKNKLVTSTRTVVRLQVHTPATRRATLLLLKTFSRHILVVVGTVLGILYEQSSPVSVIMPHKAAEMLNLILD
jgi:hypothetical protein